MGRDCCRSWAWRTLGRLDQFHALNGHFHQRKLVQSGLAVTKIFVIWGRGRVGNPPYGPPAAAGGDPPDPPNRNQKTEASILRERVLLGAAKADVADAVGGGAAVTDGRARVLVVVVPRAAPKHLCARSPTAQTSCLVRTVKKSWQS